MSESIAWYVFIYTKNELGLEETQIAKLQSLEKATNCYESHKKDESKYRLIELVESVNLKLRSLKAHTGKQSLQ